MSEVWIMKYLAQSAEDGTMPLLTCVVAPEVSGGELYEPLIITGAPEEETGEVVRRREEQKDALGDEREGGGRDV